MNGFGEIMVPEVHPQFSGKINWHLGSHFPFMIIDGYGLFPIPNKSQTPSKHSHMYIGETGPKQSKFRPKNTIFPNQIPNLSESQNPTTSNS